MATQRKQDTVRLSKSVQNFYKEVPRPSAFYTLNYIFMSNFVHYEYSTIL